MKRYATVQVFTTAARSGIVGMACVLMSAASSAGAAEVLKADIPFAFVAGVDGKPFPAGAYEFDISRAEDKVSIRGPRGAVAAETILTTLGPPLHSTADHAHLVFDKVGDACTLSELWEPNTDGLLVHVTRAKHDHQTVHLKK